MTSRQFFECRRCIMNSDADKDLVLDSAGICNHCRRYETLLPDRVLTGADGEAALAQIVDTIRKHGEGREYDCLIGVSGGVDSTYVAYLTKKLNLRPLAIHLDNGWNSELAVRNIELTMERLGIDLYTEVLDWDEFRDLQMSFLKASTPDMDVPTDHAIQALLWRQAEKHNIKYIISGMNFATESTHVKDWAYGHWDWPYIKDIHRRFGNKRLRAFPHYSYFYLLYVNIVRSIRSISILNYVDYDKPAAMDILSRELGWKYYGGKHYESVYTRFIQGYILPEKFGIDKRYGHLSDLIRCGKLTRDDAIEEINKPAYPEEMFSKDKKYFLKKFGITDQEFQEIICAPVKSFRDYRNTDWVGRLLRHAITLARKLGLYPR